MTSAADRTDEVKGSEADDDGECTEAMAVGPVNSIWSCEDTARKPGALSVEQSSACVRVARLRSLDDFRTERN